MAHFKVDRRGSCFLNGKAVPLEDVKGECARLARIGGVVFYYREAPEEEAPCEAEAVIDAICEARLPLTFVSRDYDPKTKVEEYLLPTRA